MSETTQDAFAVRFETLTGNPPFPWQTALFERFVGNDVPSRCDVPTGLGKTSVLAIWLLALADHAERGTTRQFSRRLVYVVNRRTVVDQATREAEMLQCRLSDPKLAAVRKSLDGLRIREGRGLAALQAPLAISTLRGQLADNASWRTDPARPAIILGTVDMVGSRLLFAAYGRGFKTKPLHAAFLAQDALLVHDEAHLEPAFQELLVAIEREQSRVASTRRDAFGRLRVLALTATSRASETTSTSPRPFVLSDADREHEVVKKRIFAKKALALHALDSKSKLADRVVELALEHDAGGQAILVFVQRVDDLQKVTRKLPKGSVAVLSGTIRGYERERLRADRVFARFDPKSNVPPDQQAQGTVYLVCTSAGEVGVDMSAEHLVCDLTPFDSMAQRFGRVNRFGDGDSRIDVVHEPFDPAKLDELAAFDLARFRTLELLGTAPLVEGARRSVSPDALAALPDDARRAAFSPSPRILALTEILLDAWALTSVRDRLPGRPPVADWLHGVAEWEPPETRVAWRQEVERVPESSDAEDLLEVYPLKPHEMLRDTTKRVFEELRELERRAKDAPLWIVGAEGDVRRRTVTDIVTSDGPKAIEGRTVLLAPRTGGLREDGSFSGREESRPELHYDVADEWSDERGKRRRVRIECGVDGETDEQRESHGGMRLVVNIPNSADEDDANESETRWRWYIDPVASDEQGSRTAPVAQTLQFHLASAEHFAREIVGALKLTEPEASAIIWAARFHDLGKERRLWQRSIGNFDPDRTLAKSENRTGVRTLTKYRHELGSLFDVERESEFQALTPDAKDLARHVIAAHHGRARPTFPSDEVFDPSHSDAESERLAREVPRRFARLQRAYGRWGLAYLESLLRAADVLASLVAESENNAQGAAAE